MSAKQLTLLDDENEMVGLTNEKKIVDLSIKNNYNLLMVGETGLGKTRLIYDRAKQAKKICSRVNLTGEIGINEILGKWLIKDGNTYWQDGILTEAMKKGHWIIFDEINAANAEILFVLNSLLDDGKSVTLVEKDNEIVIPEEGFMLFATMNPVEDYVGTKELNASLVSRFHMILDIKPYEPTVEVNILKQHSATLSDALASFFVDMGNMIRKLKSNGDISYFCSTRDLINLSKVYISAQGSGLDLAECIYRCIYAKANKNDISKMHDTLIEIFTNNGVDYKSINLKDSIDNKYLFDRYKKQQEKIEKIVKEKTEELEKLNRKIETIDAQLIKKIMDGIK